MYIWVILATFLAMLASYTLAIRPDMRSITVEPVVEAVIGKMITQHEAAKNYIKYRKYPYTGDRKKVDYRVGIIDDASLTNELPHGYSLTGDYATQVFCMSHDFATAYPHSTTNNPCSINDNMKMVVTYGEIPVRWMNLATAMQRPNLDFMNAMRSIIDVEELFGYIAPAASSTVSEDNPSGSSVALVDRNGSTFKYVPKAIVNDATFKARCDVSANKICIIYMSNI